jgi:alkylated DNA nucleotide flippase Atl1
MVVWDDKKEMGKLFGLTRSDKINKHKNSDPAQVPCHRVVFADGSLSKNYAFGGEKAQRAKLKSEGVKLIGEKVDLLNSKSCKG